MRTRGLPAQKRCVSDGTVGSVMVWYNESQPTPDHVVCVAFTLNGDLHKKQLVVLHATVNSGSHIWERPARVLRTHQFSHFCHWTDWLTHVDQCLIECHLIPECGHQSLREGGGLTASRTMPGSGCSVVSRAEFRRSLQGGRQHCVSRSSRRSLKCSLNEL